MTYKTWIAELGLAIALLVGGPAAEAATIVVSTPPGSTQDSFPVNITATFVTSLDHITITIVNNLSNPTSVIQGLSDLFFRTTVGSLDGTLDSSSGLERTINKTKSGNTYTDGSTVSTGWLLQDHVALISPSIIWTNERYRRAIYIAIGHDPSALSNKAYQTLLRDSILWAASK